MANRPTQGPGGHVSQGDLELGDSPEWSLGEIVEEEQGPKESPRKGLGPKKDRAVGFMPSLTPVWCQKAPEAQEAPEPMEVQVLGGTPGWLLEEDQVAQVSPEAPQAGTSEMEGRADPRVGKGAGDKGWSLHIRHNSSGDKYRVWTLGPERPILVLGDSNVGRMPPLERGNVEVDCYPGANLSQAYFVLKHKAPIFKEAQHVVLAFGLNDKDQRDPVKLKKLAERLQGAAAGVFPNAVLHFPLINLDEVAGACGKKYRNPE